MATRPTATAGRRRTPVSVDEIVRTALTLIDEAGLEALTMRRLADAIGVQPMTLYRYLPNKEAILAEVAEHLWRELPPVDPGITDWKERLRAMWQQLFDLMVRHPHAVPLIARGGSYSASAGAGTAGMVTVLKDAGFPPGMAGQFVHAASALVVGFAFAQLWQQEARQGRGPARPAGEAVRVPPELLAFTQALGPFRNEEFGDTLSLLLDGFERRLQDAT